MTGEDTLVILKCQDVEKRRLEIAKEAHRVRKEANILKKKRCEEKATKNKKYIVKEKEVEKRKRSEKKCKRPRFLESSSDEEENMCCVCDYVYRRGMI